MRPTPRRLASLSPHVPMALALPPSPIQAASLASFSPFTSSSWFAPPPSTTYAYPSFPALSTPNDSTQRRPRPRLRLNTRLSPPLPPRPTVAISPHTHTCGRPPHLDTSASPGFAQPHPHLNPIPARALLRSTSAPPQAYVPQFQPVVAQTTPPSPSVSPSVRTYPGRVHARGAGREGGVREGGVREGGRREGGVLEGGVVGGGPAPAPRTVAYAAFLRTLSSLLASPDVGDGRGDRVESIIRAALHTHFPSVARDLRLDGLVREGSVSERVRRVTALILAVVPVEGDPA